MKCLTELASQRSMILFKESIKSKYTKRNYASHINRFKKFTGVTNAGQWLEVPPKDLQMMLEDYAIHLRHTANPNSIPSVFRGIKHFFVMNRIDLNWDVIRKMFPQKQKTTDLKPYTTKDIYTILSYADSLRDKALVHFLASTGARIGVFDHVLSIRHLQKMPSGCAAVLLYAGDVEEYWAFLTCQATKALEAYHRLRKHNGDLFGPDTPMFATSKSTSRQLSWSGSRSVIYRIVSKSNIRLKTGKRFNIQVDHGFRKRYNTILKLDNSVNYNIAEKLMGHKNGLDGTYFTPSLDDLFREFRKVAHKIEV